MKQKKFNKKLSLNKEKISSLNSNAMSKIKGGDGTIEETAGQPSCGCTVGVLCVEDTTVYIISNDGIRQQLNKLNYLKLSDFKQTKRSANNRFF